MAEGKEQSHHRGCISCYGALPPSRTRLNIILLGNSWSLRSSVGNLLLKMTVINTKTKPLNFQTYEDEMHNQPLIVVNTPDLQDTDIVHFTAYIRCLSGPLVFLLVLQPEDVTEEHKYKLYSVLQSCSDEAFDQSLVLIPMAKAKTGVMQKLLRKRDHDDQHIRDMIIKCKYRYLYINSTADSNQDEFKREELFTRIGQMLKETKENLSCGPSQIIFLTHFVHKAIQCASDLRLKLTATEENRPCLNLVLCGRAGAEKSSVVESIFGQGSVCMSPEQCVGHQGKVCGRWVSLLELPPLAGSGKPVEELMEPCLRFLSRCGPQGIQAFILVLPLGPLTIEDKCELRSIQDVFSSAVCPFTIILFTIDSDLYYPDVEGTDLQLLCQPYAGHLIFNTRGQHQVTNLLDSLETFAKNKPHSFTTETLVYGQRRMITTLREIQDLQVRRTVRGSEASADCLRITLVGKTGCGKSSSGNTILRRTQFRSILSSVSVTQSCEKAEAEVHWRRITVVDTPGLFQDRMSNDYVIDEMTKCISLLAPGPHVFLLVLELGRFTEMNETIDLIRKSFGKESQKYTMILFTHGDKLEGEISIEEYMTYYIDSSLKKVLSDFGNRFHVFNNRDKTNVSQAKELLKKIDAMVEENGGGCFTNDMFQHAEVTIKKEMERIMKEKEEEMRREREEMERKYQQEMEDIKLQMEKQKEQTEKEITEREQELREKEEKIKMEEDERKKEQEKREEEERKRREQEELQRQEWEQKQKELEEKIKSESESKEATEQKLQESRRKMEEQREKWEKEREEWQQKTTIFGFLPKVAINQKWFFDTTQEIRKQQEEEMKRKYQQEMEDIKLQMEKQKEQTEKDRKWREQELREKEEKIQMEEEQLKKEQEKRRKQEEHQREELEQKQKELEEKIKSVSESKEAIEQKLKESRRKMEEQREKWENEKEEWWQKRKQEDEEKQQYIKNLREEYERQRLKDQEQRREEDRIRKQQQEEMKRKYQQEMEEIKQEMDKQKEQMETEIKEKEKELREKEGKIKMEEELRKKEQEKREEEERKRREQEELKCQELEQRQKDLEEKIKSESESKEATEQKLQESRRKMEEQREKWENEKEEWWQKRKQEDEERRQYLKNLREEYDKQRLKDQEQRREEDRIRKQQEEEMKRKYQQEMEEIKQEMDKQKEQMETEIKEKEQELKEKEKEIQMEQELQKKDQEKREEEERKRREQEELKCQELEQRQKELEEKIKSESESKEAIEQKLQESRRKMEEQKEKWEKEKEEWWQKRKLEDEEKQQYLKNLREEYDKQKLKDQEQRREEDRIRKQQEEENIEELKKKHEKEIEDRKKASEKEARTRAEEEFQRKEKEKLEEHRKNINSLVKCICRKQRNVKRINKKIKANKEQMKKETDEKKKEALLKVQEKELSELIQTMLEEEDDSTLHKILKSLMFPLVYQVFEDWLVENEDKASTIPDPTSTGASSTD